jgi:hypothetical protein
MGHDVPLFAPAATMPKFQMTFPQINKPVLIRIFAMNHDEKPPIVLVPAGIGNGPVADPAQ